MNKKKNSNANIKLLATVCVVLFFIQFIVNYLFYGCSFLNSLLLSLFISGLSFMIIVIGDKLRK